MAHMQEYLVQGRVVQKEECQNAFEKISNLVTEWERAAYPEMSHLSMHKVSHGASDRLRLICHLNPKSVTEANRVCDFKLIAVTRDDGLTATVNKNVCLTHSCQTPDFKKGNVIKKTIKKTVKITPVSREDQAAGNGVGSGECVPIVGRKRSKIEQQEENFKEAWKLIKSKRMNVDDRFQEKMDYLDQKGIYEASHLRDLDISHIETLAEFLKEIPKKQWTRLLTGA